MAAEADPDAILEDIQRVTRELGKPPSTDDYRDRGEFTVRTVYNHFDGFVAAREAAGVSEGELRPNSREELLEDIRRVDEMVEGEPTLIEYDKYGEYSPRGVTYRFGSWTDAKKTAGVYTGGHRSLPTEDEILEDIRRVDSEIDGVLSQTKYDSKGEFYSTTAIRVIGNWSEACERAGIDRPNMGPKDVEDSTVINDIQRVAEEIAHTPSKTEYDEFGRFTYGIIQTRFSTMSEAVKQAGLDPRPEGGQHGELHPLWEGGVDPYYGPNWDRKKQKIRNRDGECKLCGLTEEQHVEEHGESLSIHHIIRFDEFDHYSVANRDENLIALCRSCHSQIDEHDSQTREKLRSWV